MARKDRLMPGGIPRYVKCFDNGGETWDRYTVIYTGNYADHPRGRYLFVGMSESPCSPQGFGQHGEIDQSQVGKHLGKRIKFNDLPQECKSLVIYDYKANWNIT